MPTPKKYFKSMERRKKRGVKFRKVSKIAALQALAAPWKKECDLKHAHLSYPAEFKEVIQDLILDGYQYRYRICYHEESGSYHRVDFANPSTKHVIEFDGPGGATNSRQRKNAIQDKHLRAAGWRVDRITYKLP